jgi:hypothetical protein
VLWTGGRLSIRHAKGGKMLTCYITIEHSPANS